MQSLDRYHAFYTAATYENFSRAAAELMVSQSAISQAIRQLEDQLSVQLFIRSGRRIRISPDGRFLYEQLTPVFQRLEQTERWLNEKQDPEQSRLIIGASDTLCRHYLLDTFSEFHRLFPRVRLEIINAPSPEIARLVRANQIDLGFVHGISDDFSDLSVRSLTKIEEVFFHAAGLDQTSFSKAELSRLPFVGLTKKSATRRLLDDYFQADTSGWKPLVEVISIDLMIDLVASGFGISYSHRNLINPSDFSIITTDQSMEQRDILLLQPHSRYPSKTLDHFLSLLKANFE